MVGIESEVIKAKKGYVLIALFSQSDDSEGVPESHVPGSRKEN